MTTGAIIMMIIGLGITWGGASLVHPPCNEK